VSSQFNQSSGKVTYISDNGHRRSIKLVAASSVQSVKEGCCTNTIPHMHVYARAGARVRFIGYLIDNVLLLSGDPVECNTTHTCIYARLYSHVHR